MMDPPSALPTSDSSASAATAIQTRLQGRWLWLARVAWLIVATVGLIGPILSIPLNIAQLEQVCTGPWAACLEAGRFVRQQDLPTLTQWGLSPPFFATYAALLPVVVTLVW